MSETGRTDTELAKGVTESTVYVTDSQGANLRAHILRVQKGADVSFRATIKDYYTGGSTIASRQAVAAGWNSSNGGFETLKDLASDYDSSSQKTGTVVAASSGDFYIPDTGMPTGNLIMEGNVVKGNSTEPFFAVLEDGTCVIRSGSEGISGVREAMGGRDFLVDGGSNRMSKDKTREPRQAIGVCGDGTVVIVNVDGREPASIGATLYDLAEIMRRQGCDRAINLDGGGSATFLTKRPGDSSLVYRNVAGDGFERKVSSSLLVVTDPKSGALSGSASVSMADSSTVFAKKSGTYTYTVNGKKASGFYAVNGKSYLFKSGKGLSKKVKVGKTTYTYKKGALTKVSDKKSGNAILGYCGAASGGTNLLYAYQYGNKALNIGLNPLNGKKNGKMMSWKGNNNLKLPWYSMRSEIKNVYVGDGVTNIGDRFLYVSDSKVFDGTATPKSKLTTLRLPDSLKTIGMQAFYYKPKLKNVVIPAKVTSIGNRAFAISGKGYLQFKSAKAPKLASKALDRTGFSKIYVKKSSAWKKFVKGNKFKKYGYKRAVKFK